MPYEKIGKNEPVCIADEVPFDIPESWEWVRLSSLVSKEIRRGKSPKYSEHQGIQVFAQKCNTKSGSIDMTLAKYLDSATFAKYPIDEYLQDQDIIVNSTGNGTLGRIGVFRDTDRIDESIIVPDSHVTVIRLLPTINKDYLLNVLRYYQPYLEKSGEGSTNQTELKPAIIANLYIPIPPQNEQIRISEKLVEIFPLIKEYDVKETLSVSLNAKFSDQLKKSILQEAVQGKLVSQDPNDEPASVLLERIRAEKEQLIKAGKIKRDKHESVIFRRDNSYYEKVDEIERCIDDELPFEIPESWKWCRLKTLTMKIGAGSTPTGGRAVYIDNGIKFIRSQNVYNDGLRLDGIAFIPATTNQKKSGSIVHPMDILLNITGASIGRCALIPDNFDIGNVNQHVMIIRCVTLNLRHWLHTVLISEYIQTLIMNVQVGVSREGLSATKLSDFLIPIPPLNEQHNIVQRIEELQPLISGM